jgi:type IX secretion system PorP/SprF family membrane protein
MEEMKTHNVTSKIHYSMGIDRLQRSFSSLIQPLIVSVLLSLVMIPSDTQAQDPTFSQFNLNQYYFNPAYTGYRGGYELAATYRTQWPNVPGKVFLGPLATYYGFGSVSFHEKGNFAGSIGVFAMQKSEGEGYLTTNTFGLSYAQHFAFNVSKSDRDPRLQLSVGFKGYFSTVGVNWDKLVFTDQLSVDYGINPNSGIGQSGTQTTKPFGDIDFGLLLWNNYKAKDKWYNELGFSMSHVLAPYISLTGSKTEVARLQRKIIVNYRSSITLKGEHISFGPIIFFEMQGKFYELNTGIDLYFKFNPSRNIPTPLTFSLLHRLAAPGYFSNTNAIIVGLTHNGRLERNNKRGDEYYIGFTADFPYQGLAGQTKEAFELTVGFIFRKKVNNGFKCPWGNSDHTADMNSTYKRFRNR